MNQAKEYDVILVNPPVSFKKMPDNEIVISYFNTLDKFGKHLLGDDDTEANYGLLSIASKIEMDRPETTIKIIDFNVIDKEIRKKKKRSIKYSDIKQELSKYSANIIGLSFMTSSYGNWGKDLVEIASKRSEYIFLGGIHPTVRYKQVMKELGEFIDGIIVGEGELVFSSIVKEILDGSGHFEKYSSIYTGEGIPTVSVLDNRELAELPVPNYSLLYDEEEYIIPRIYTTRGCSNNCKMCSVGDFYKTKSRQDIVQVDVSRFRKDITTLYERYKIKHFVMGDLTFSENNPRFKRILDILINLRNTENINVDWWCQTRGDLLNEESAKKMKEAGFKQVAIGCEAATNKQLEFLNKKESVETIKSSLQLLRKYDINTQGYWILGVPGETRQSIKKTQEMILNYLSDDLMVVPHITILVPYPNTKLSKEQKGIKIDHYNYKDYWMNCDLNGYGMPVYHTIDENGQILLSSEEIYNIWLETLELITKFMEEKYNEF